MAPGSQVVTNYYEKAGLWPYLEKLGFHLVGYGCATCIGNSGPLDDNISAAVNEHDLAIVSVLSGNRNFEGRINPDVKMNYLASPPLVVAYALAGTMSFDFDTEPLGFDTEGAPVFLKDIWPTPEEVQATIDSTIDRAMFEKDYADVFAGDDRWRSLPTPEGDTFAWDNESTYVRKPRTLTEWAHNQNQSTTFAQPACSRNSATRSQPTTSAQLAPLNPVPRQHNTSKLMVLSAVSSTPTGHVEATTR